MTILIEQMTFTPTGATAVGANTPSSAYGARSFGDWTGDIINVKNFVCADGKRVQGDGAHDDTTGIQAALDTAFGTSGSPHGQDNVFLNKPVFFPAGNYVITSPLLVTDVKSAHIFGAGMQATEISASFNSSTLAGGNGVIAAFTTITGAANNGSGAIRLTVSNTAPIATYATGGATPAALMVYGVTGTTEANGQWNFTIASAGAPGTIDLTGSTFTNAYVNGGSIGKGSGIMPVFMCDGFAYGKIERMRLHNSGANTVGIFLYGGFSSSPIHISDLLLDGSEYGIVGGVQSGNDVSEVCVTNVKFQDNHTAGIYIEGNNTLNLALHRCGFDSCGTGGAGHTPFSGQAAGGSGGSTAAAIVINGGAFPLVSQCDFGPNNVLDIYTNATNPTCIYGCRTECPKFVFVDGSSTAVDIRACVQSNGAPTYFLQLNGSASAGVAHCSGFGPKITSLTNAPMLYVRDCSPIDISGFTGHLAEYISYVDANARTVANLPTAAAKFQGIRFFVTDCTVAAAGNFALIIDDGTHGGGANLVPVWCDGTNWRIG